MPAEPTPELAAVLRRYLQIQADEQRLKEEKASLQEKLAQHMTQSGLPHWFPEVDGQPLKVRCQEHTVIEYDEAVLKERLAERFDTLLAPDLRKIRRHLAELTPALQPVLRLVGSPSPDKVRAAIEQGSVTKEEFAGAFTKTVRRTVAVARARRDAPDQGSPETE